MTSILFCPPSVVVIVSVSISSHLEVCAAMSLLFIPTAFETSETWVYCLFPPCWRLWGFLCGFMWGTVFLHVCKCRCSDVNSVLLYIWVCVCVCEGERERERESWLCPLEFPENPDSTHLIATHHIVTPSPRYGTHSAHQALPFPFTLPSFLSLSTFFYCSIHTFFVGSCILLKQHSWGDVLLRAPNW